MKHGILGMIEAYDNERESYIRQLEDQVEELQSKLARSAGLIASGESLREQVMLKCILSGGLNRSDDSFPPFQGTPSEKT